MAEVRWTPQAADDLEAIAEFIAEDSPHYASLFIMDVLAAVERVGRLPNAGRLFRISATPRFEKPCWETTALSIGVGARSSRF